MSTDWERDLRETALTCLPEGDPIRRKMLLASDELARLCSALEAAYEDAAKMVEETRGYVWDDVAVSRLAAAIRARAALAQARGV